MPVNDLPSYSPQRARGAAEEEHMALWSMAQPLAREVGLVLVACARAVRATQLSSLLGQSPWVTKSLPCSLMSFLGKG